MPSVAPTASASQAPNAPEFAAQDDSGVPRETTPRFAVNPETLPVLSAEALHTIVLRCRGTQNRARYLLLSALEVLSESKRYLDLGFPSIIAYAQATLGYRKSATYDTLRVAKAFGHLPRCLERFLEGTLSWSALRQISRVAATDTEEAWLDFAANTSPERVQGEVEDALKKNRNVPRAHGYGLPNLETSLKIPLTLAELEIVQKGIDIIAQTLAPSLGGEAASARDVLLYLSERALATASGDPWEGQPDRLDPHYNVVYQQCSSCQRSRMATSAGMVEVAPEVVACVAGDAHREVIRPEDERPVPEDSNERSPDGANAQEPNDPPPLDPPNSARLTRRVRLRDGLLCTNPHCCRAARHSHHVQFRSQGGRTALHNEVAVCEVCHALIHQGRLRVVGSPGDTATGNGLAWSTRADRIAIDLEEEQRNIAALPIVRVAATPIASLRKPPPDSTAVESRTPHREAAFTLALESFHYLPQTLTRLGYTKGEAEDLVRDALGVLIDEETELTEQEIVQQALNPARRRGVGSKREPC